MSRITEELHFLLQAIKESKLGKITKQKILTELTINGISGLITILITSLIHRFFIPRDWKNLDNARELIKHSWRTRVKNEDDGVTVVDSYTYEIINWSVIFIVGLIVFTIVENVIERYFEIRKNRRT